MQYIEIDEDSEDTFWTWATQYDHSDMLYYIRLEQMECGSCKTLFQLDYGRFKTHEEVSAYEKTLGDPYVAARNEFKVFQNL